MSICLFPPFPPRVPWRGIEVDLLSREKVRTLTEFYDCTGSRFEIDIKMKSLVCCCFIVFDPFPRSPDFPVLLSYNSFANTVPGTHLSVRDYPVVGSDRRKMGSQTKVEEYFGQRTRREERTTKVEEF